MPTSFITGQGNISCYTANTTVTGVGTNFLLYRPNSQLLTASSASIGTIKSVSNATELVLVVNAAQTINNQQFNLNLYYTGSSRYTWETGTITASAYTVTGSGTSFSTDIVSGDQLFIKSADDTPFFLGTVDAVESNTVMYLKQSAESTSTQYFTKKISVPAGNDATGYQQLVNSLTAATDKGLFANQQQVHSYHPPIPDPITGVLVNLPAAVVEKHAGANGNNVSDLGYGESSQVASVREFDVAQGRFSSSLNYVYDGLVNSQAIQSVVQNSTDSAVYAQTIQNYYPQTSADRYQRLARPTDSLQTAKQYFSTTRPNESLNSEQKQNLQQTADLSTRAKPNSFKTLNSTGVPISTPGVLNVVAQVKQTTKPTYTPPTFTAAEFANNT